MSKQRSILCLNCNNTTSQIPLARMIYKATDSVGNQHMATLDQREAVKLALAEEGISLGEWKRITAKEVVRQGLCKSCTDSFHTEATKVIEGGIYYSCSECGTKGILDKSDYTMAIRENAGEQYVTKNEQGQYQPLLGEFDSCSKHKVTIPAPNDKTPQ